MVYGCDAPWWTYRKGLPEFGGLKVCWAGDRGYVAAPFPDLRRIKIRKDQDRLLFDEIGFTGSGGNSGFQALNLAVQWGVEQILLVGFDMTDECGVHWYGHNAWTGANNPSRTNFKRWIAAYETAAKQLEERGVEVVNCSLDSALNCFPKMTLEDALGVR